MPELEGKQQQLWEIRFTTETSSKLCVSSISQSRVPAPDELHRAASPAGSDELNNSITDGVVRRHSQSIGSSQDLSEQSRKWLKLEARELARAHGLSSSKPLLQLAEAKSVLSMLLSVTALLLWQQEMKEKSEFANAKVTLTSKDFESTLRACLTVCLLFSNIIAYLVDSHIHIITFIKSHHTLFKIPEKVTEDVEPWSTLGKMVSKDLSSIQDDIKTALHNSFTNGKNIIDIFQSAAGANLHKVLRQWVASMLDVNLDALEEELAEKLNLGDAGDGNGATFVVSRPNSSDESHNDIVMGQGNSCSDNSGELDQDANGIPDTEYLPEQSGEAQDSNAIQQEEDDESGILPGRNDKFPLFIDRKFWNYVDHSL
ncbi:hypothetical protein F5I97DRAFT_1927607 [Phlebopus sp. FC_14]|nr:hypothetical protein F5I97DRAFT_1927607 [Phlebopus sp. FC_14]